MQKGKFIPGYTIVILALSVSLIISACQDDKRAAITHRWKIPSEDFSMNINRDSTFTGTEHNHMMEGKWEISKDGSQFIVINPDNGKRTFRIKELNDKSLILFDEREKEDLKFERND